MDIVVNTEDNSLRFNFLENAPFDIQILEKAQSAFAQLTPKEIIEVNVYGIVPIEISAYLVEVANHCKMELTIFDDHKCFVFMQQLTMTASSSIKLEFKGETNGS